MGVSKGVGSRGVGALSALAYKDWPSAYGIGARGGNQSVIAAMQQHSGSTAVVAAACLALTNLALIADNQADIGACCGVEAVLEAREEHAGNTKLAEVAKEALFIITWENPKLLVLQKRYETVVRGTKACAGE